MPRIEKQAAAPAKRKVGGIEDRISALDEGLDTNLKINLYGQPSSGKTTLWSTFPAPILVVICSGSEKKPGELMSINTAENRKRIQKFNLQSIVEMPAIVEHIKSSGAYKTVVLDHATGLQELALREELGLDVLPAQLSWGLASREQYGKVSLQVKEILRALFNLDANIVIVAQEREFNTRENTGNDMIKPYVASALSAKIVEFLVAATNQICETFKRPRTVDQVIEVAGQKQVMKVAASGVDYCLRIGPHSVYTTKFRMPLEFDKNGNAVKPLPEVIVNPNYNKILAVTQGKY